ncbi:RNA-binding domain-containing protein [Cryobacterium sp. M91]|uniref:RNA-binding domain-containing protein n=1 Tax=Cryobacterium sp. M91 TaxID=2048294 RepID=UPI000CE4DBE4|nr:RNA-binding domain-containing protein [Cryobacterium sp. M91]
MTVREEAESALAEIGDGWDADSLGGTRLDFKQTPPSGDRRAPEKFLKDLAESVVCFANAQNGGILIIGVKDKAATRSEAIVGVDTTKWLINDIVNNMHARTSPSITVHPHTLIVDGKSILVLGVPDGSDVYSTTEGFYKIRLNDRCVALEGEQLRGLRAIRQGRDWSAEPASIEWSQLSRAAIERGAQLLSLNGNDELASIALSDFPAFAKATELATANGGPNRAAVLLYGNPEALKTIFQWGVSVQSRPSLGGDPRILMRRDDTSLPLVLLLDQLLTTVGSLARSQFIRVGAEQIELVDYPRDALREVIANAFAHRDWEATGVVEIIHSPEELVVTSPGGLLPSLRVDRLLHDAASPRNPKLAGHMARLRLAEMSGLGFDRIFRSVALLGKEPPALEDGPRFRVALIGGAGDEAFARFLRSSAMPDALATDVDVLTVLTALRHNRSVNADTVSTRLQRNPNDTQRILIRMHTAELIQPTKSTTRRAHPNYLLSSRTIAGLRSALTYRTDSIDADDEKLLRHLKRHDRISNEDVRNYLDCDVVTARNRLTRLRTRKLIDFAPDSPRRGPMVVYVATGLNATTAAKPTTAAPTAEDSTPRPGGPVGEPNTLF